MALLAQLVDGVVVNKFDLNKQWHTIGRHNDSDIQIDDIAVSTHHAVIAVVESTFLEGSREFFISDLDSTNGTHVNNIRIEKQRLQNGDLLRIAWNNFRFIDENEAEDTEKTAHILMDTSSKL